MIRTLCTLLIFISPVFIKAQSVIVGIGPSFIHQKDDVEIIKEMQGERFENDGIYLSAKLKYPISKQYIIYLDYTSYNMSSVFYLRDIYGTSQIFGWLRFSRNHLFRTEISYNIFKESKFTLQPTLSCGVQRSSLTGPGVPFFSRPHLSPLFDPITGFRDIYEITQFVTGVGLKVGYLFWNRFEFFLNIDYVKGFKRTSIHILEYSYDGVMQPDAIRYTDGSATLLGLGIGIKLWDRFD